MSAALHLPAPFPYLRSPMLRLLAFSAVLLLASGCSWLPGKKKDAEPSSAGDSPTGPAAIRVEYLGFASFRMTSSIGITLLTDPYRRGLLLGKPAPTLPADIMTISHESETASYIRDVSNTPIGLRSRIGEGDIRAGSILFRGIDTAPAGGTGGMNITYSWRMDGVRFCHLGKLTSALAPSTAARIGRVDVLFLPTDPELGPSPAAQNEVIALLAPRIIIPITYSGQAASAGRLRPTPGTSIPVVVLPSQTFEVSQQTLPDAPAWYLPAGPGK